MTQYRYWLVTVIDLETGKTRETGVVCAATLEEGLAHTEQALRMAITDTPEVIGLSGHEVTRRRAEQIVGTKNLPKVDQQKDSGDTEP
jgi:hypothetical protein